MTLSIPNMVGLLGVTLIVLFYFLIQTERISADQLSYSIGNGLGAAFILLSLLFDFNLPSFIFESIWLAISLYGAIKSLRRRSASS